MCMLFLDVYIYIERSGIEWVEYWVYIIVRGRRIVLSIIMLSFIEEHEDENIMRVWSGCEWRVNNLMVVSKYLHSYEDWLNHNIKAF